MKKQILVALLGGVLLLTAFTGCGADGGAGKTAGGKKDELVYVNYRDIRNLNPHLYAGEMYAQSMLYDTLVTNTEKGYVGCLAESWTISPPRFPLREGWPNTRAPLR